MQIIVQRAGAYLKIPENANCGFERIPTTRSQQWLYLLGAGGVVYSEAHHHFAGLDAAGVAAYRAFDAGASLRDLQQYSNAHRTVTEHPIQILDELHAIHALARGIFPDGDVSADWPLLDTSVGVARGTINIEIHGIPIAIDYPKESLEYLCLDYLQNCVPTTQPARCHLSVQSTPDGWAIIVNGCRFFSLQQKEQVGLGLMHAIRSLLYAEGEYDIAFHAAMVAHQNCGVMLCAPREYGKSTLAAHLVAQGFDLLTDEPALLNLDTGSVVPLRLPISLKEGSWPSVLQEWPKLAETPIHIRSDGVKIRLAHVPAARSGDRPRRLTHIVFPQYSPDSHAVVEPLLPLHTLRLLNEGGMLLANHLVRDSFEAFLKLICETPAYKFRYTSIEDIKQLVTALRA